MDKYEMNLKLEQMRIYAQEGEYASAAEIADEFDWNRIKQGKLLNLAANVYGANKEFEKEKEVLLLAYERSPLGRQLAYRLCTVSIRLNQIEEAEEFYEDFLEVSSPSDSTRLILQYRLEKAKGADISRQIEILKQLFEEDMDEKWAYQLAVLYAKNDQKEECIAVCDEIILWFRKGDYVKKARKLRNLFVPEELRAEEPEEEETETADNDEKVSENTAVLAGLSMEDIVNMESAVAGEDTKPAAEKQLAENGEPAENEQPAANEQPSETPAAAPSEAPTEMPAEEIRETPDTAAPEVIQPAPEIPEAEQTEFPEVQEPEVTELPEPEGQGDEEAAATREGDADPIGSIPDNIRQFAKEKPLPEIKLSPELKLDIDGQISMDVDQKHMPDKQITGQLSIDEILKQLEAQGILNSETVNGAINVVKEGTGALPKLDLPPEEEPEDPAQVKLDVDEEGNLLLQEPENAALIDEEKDIYELGIQDLMSEEERAKLRREKREAQQEEDVLKLVERLESKAPEEEKTTEDFDIPDTPDQTLRLTWDQRQVFKEYLGAPGLEYALAKTLKNLVENNDKDGSSKRNNVIIMGEKKSGKTTIALELIKMANKELGRKSRKVAKVNGNIINKRGILTAMPRLIGSDLIIEDAGVINPKMMRQMIDTFKGYTDEMIVVLEDERVTMEHMLNSYPFMDSMFENRIVIKEYDIHEWVAYAKAYAKESGYLIDEMGTLALYAKIDEVYGINRGLEKSSVEEIIDDAIERAEHTGFGKIISAFSKKSKDNLGVLKETNFQ